MRPSKVGLVLFLCFSAIAETPPGFPKEVADLLLKNPLFLYPESRDFVRRWVAKEITPDISYLEILDGSKISDTDLANMMLLGPEGKEGGARALLAALAAKLGRQSLFDRLTTEAGKPGLSVSQRQALMTALATPANKKRKEALPLAEALVREGHVAWIKSDSALDLLREHMTPERLDLFLEASKKALGGDARNSIVNAVTALVNQDPKFKIPPKAMAMIREAVSEEPPYFYAIELAKNKFPELLGELVKAKLSGDGDLPAVLEALGPDAARALIKKERLEKQTTGWVLERLKKGGKVDEFLGRGMLDYLPESDRVTILEAILAGDQLADEDDRTLFVRAFESVSAESRKKLLPKLVARLKELEAETYKRRKMPVPDEAKLLASVHRSLAPLDFTAELGDGIGAASVKAQIDGNCAHYLPIKESHNREFEAPVKPKGPGGKVGVIHDWRPDATPAQLIAYVKRHADVLVPHAERCLGDAPSGANFCYNAKTLHGAGKLDYAAVDKYLAVSKAKKWDPTQVAYGARCLSHYLPAPASAGERDKLHAMWKQVLPKLDRADDHKQDYDAFLEAERLSTLTLGKPLESEFISYVDKLLKPAGDKRAGACEMTCRLRKAKDRWKAPGLREQSEFREAPSEQSFSEDNLWAHWDLSSAPLCGEKPAGAENYLSPLPFALRTFTPDQEKEAERQVLAKEKAADDLTRGAEVARAGVDAAVHFGLVPKETGDNLKYDISVRTSDARREILAEAPSYPGHLGNSLVYGLSFGKGLVDKMPDAKPDTPLGKWKADIERNHKWAADLFNKQFTYRGNSVFSNYAVGLMAVNSKSLPADYVTAMRATAKQEDYRCTIPYGADVKHRMKKEEDCDEAVFRSIVYYEALSAHETTEEGKAKADEAVYQCLLKYAHREALARAQSRRGQSTHVGCSGIAPYYYWGTVPIAADAGHRLLASKLPAVKKLTLGLAMSRIRNGLQDEFDAADGTFVTKGTESYARRPAYVNPLLGLAAASFCRRDRGI